MHALQNIEADRVRLEEDTELTKPVKNHTNLLEELRRRVTTIGEHLRIDAGRFLTGAACRWRLNYRALRTPDT